MIDNRQWENEQKIPTKNYKCGHAGCGREVGPEKGWRHVGADGKNDGWIYICNNCKRPTFFDLTENIQIPGEKIGNDIENLPSDIEKIWDELRNTTSYSAFTSCVMVGRKLLMHIAIEQGADENKKFIEYVNYLDTNHYTPPNSKEWVDKIRTIGNEANHEIKIMSEEDAKDIIIFLEMLLKFLYEFPSKLK